MRCTQCSFHKPISNQRGATKTSINIKQIVSVESKGSILIGLKIVSLVFLWHFSQDVWDITKIKHTIAFLGIYLNFIEIIVTQEETNKCCLKIIVFVTEIPPPNSW